jgi:hypothetical protein
VTARAALCVAALLVCGCPHARPPGTVSLHFWSLVKVTTAESSFAFKCLHEQDGGSIHVRCFTPVEIPLFDVLIDGNAVSAVASSQAVEDRIPFDVVRIGVDIWRVQVARDDSDLAGFRELNDADLPEDRVLVEEDGDGNVVHKSFLKGDVLVAEAIFLEIEDGRAGRIAFRSVAPSYGIEIVQGD